MTIIQPEPPMNRNLLRRALETPTEGMEILLALFAIHYGTILYWPPDMPAASPVLLNKALNLWLADYIWGLFLIALGLTRIAVVFHAMCREVECLYRIRAAISLASMLIWGVIWYAVASSGVPFMSHKVYGLLTASCFCIALNLNEQRRGATQRESELSHHVA